MIMIASRMFEVSHFEQFIRLSEQCIELKLKKGRLVIQGSQLEITYFSGFALRGRGEIKEVQFR